jgi:hypothetical protein
MELLLVLAGAVAGLFGQVFLHHMKARDERDERLMNAYAELFAAVHQAWKASQSSEAFWTRLDVGRCARARSRCRASGGLSAR